MHIAAQYGKEGESLYLRDFMPPTIPVFGDEEDYEDDEPDDDEG